MSDFKNIDEWLKDVVVDTTTSKSDTVNHFQEKVKLIQCDYGIKNIDYSKVHFGKWEEVPRKVEITRIWVDEYETFTEEKKFTKEEMLKILNSAYEKLGNK